MSICTSSRMVNHLPALSSCEPPRTIPARPAASTAQRSQECTRSTISKVVTLLPFRRGAAEDDQQFPNRRTSRVVCIPLRHVRVELVGGDLRLVLDVPGLEFGRTLDPSA